MKFGKRSLEMVLGNASDPLLVDDGQSHHHHDVGIAPRRYGLLRSLATATKHGVMKLMALSLSNVVMSRRPRPRRPEASHPKANPLGADPAELYAIIGLPLSLTPNRPDLATTGSEHLASKAADDEDPEEALIEAPTVIAAMGLVSDIKDDLDAAAEKLANQWLTQYRVPIKSLSDERQEVYREIQTMSADPLPVDLARPNTWLQMTTARKADGTEEPLPRFEKHLLCGSDGTFPGDFNSWEARVVTDELKRKGTIGWYRNPARASQDSLGVTYDEGSERVLRPDFIFFARLPDSTVAADIVDPHGIQFADALPKLRGLAKYAEANAGVYRRIEVFAEIDGKAHVVDLTEKSARAAVESAATVRDVYFSAAAHDYVS